MVVSPPTDRDTLAKIVRESITSSLPPAGFDPLAISEEALLELGFPARPNPDREPAEYAFWRKLFAPPLAFEAFDFSILPLFTTQDRAFFGQLPRRQTSSNWSGAY